MKHQQINVHVNIRYIFQNVSMRLTKPETHPPLKKKKKKKKDPTFLSKRSLTSIPK